MPAETDGGTSDVLGKLYLHRSAIRDIITVDVFLAQDSPRIDDRLHNGIAAIIQCELNLAILFGVCPCGWSR